MNNSTHGIKLDIFSLIKWFSTRLAVELDKPWNISFSLHTMIPSGNYVELGTPSLHLGLKDTAFI